MNSIAKTGGFRDRLEHACFTCQGGESGCTRHACPSVLGVGVERSEKHAGPPTRGVPAQVCTCASMQYMSAARPAWQDNTQQHTEVVTDASTACRSAPEDAQWTPPLGDERPGTTAFNEPAQTILHNPPNPRSYKHHMPEKFRADIASAC